MPAQKETSNLRPPVRGIFIFWKMNFKKLKRLHAEFEREKDFVTKRLQEKFEWPLCVSVTGDGLCVLFDDQENDATGVTLEEFEAMMKEPNFDPANVKTYL